MELTTTQEKIMKHIKGKVSISDLSFKTKLHVATVNDNIKKLQKCGMVRTEIVFKKGGQVKVVEKSADLSGFEFKGVLSHQRW